MKLEKILTQATAKIKRQAWVLGKTRQQRENTIAEVIITVAEDAYQQGGKDERKRRKASCARRWKRQIGTGAMNVIFIKDCTDGTSPCPFCGNGDESKRSLMALATDVIKIHYVKCEGCAACGPVSAFYKDEESAIENWNNRAGQDDPHE